MTRLRLWLGLLVALFAGSAALLLVGLVWLGLSGAPLAAQLAQQVLAGQLRIESADGGLFGPIQLTGVQFENEGLRLELDRAELDWRPSLLRLNELRVTRLELGRLQLWLKPTPASEPQPIQTRLPFDLRLDQARLARLELHPADAGPQAEPLLIEDIEAALTWRGERIQLQRLSARHALSGPLSAEGEILLAPGSIGFEPLRLSGPGSAELQGRLGLMGSASQLSLELRQLRWPLREPAQVELPELRLQLAGALTGALDARIELAGQLRAALPGAEPGGAKSAAVQVEGRAHLGDGELQLQQLRLRGPAGSGSLEAEGLARWTPALQLEAEVRLAQLDPGLLLADFPGQLSGLLAAHTVAGGQGLPRVQFSARLSDSRLRGYPLALEARGSAEHQGETTRLRLDSFELRSGRARLSAQGALLPTLDAALSLDAPDLQGLLPELAGALSLQAQLQGEPANPALRAEGQARALRYQDLSLAEGRLDIDYDPSRRSTAQLSASGLAQGDTRLTSLKLVVDGRAEQHRLTLNASMSEPSSELRLVLDGAADVVARRWAGRLSESHLQPPYGPAWSQEAPAALQVSAGLQALEKVCWRLEAQGRACIAIRHAPPLLSLSTELLGVETAGFAALLPSGWAIETRLDGGGLLELRDGEPSRLDFALRNGAGRIYSPNTPELALLPGGLSIVQDGALWRAKLDLKLDRANLSGEASLPMQGGVLLQRPLGGTLRLAVPELGWLESFIPGTSEIAGRLDGALRLGGSLAAPQFDGSLRLADGQLRIDAAGVQLRELRAELRSGGAGVLRIEASARSGDGLLTVQGEADPAARSARIEINGDNLQAANLPDARVWVSPKLLFEQRPDGMKLSGELLVPRAEITPRKLGGGIVNASSDQVIVGAKKVDKGLPLDASVRVRMGDAVRFDGFGLKARFGGQLTVMDSPGAGSTRARGELRLLDAVYKAYGQDLSLETGRILFSGGPITEPTVDLKAVRRPSEDVTVTLQVRGTLDKPTFDISSSPAMTQEQQLGWLLLGRPIDSGGEFSAASAALSLGLAGGDQLTKKLTQGLGIDTISLGAEAGQTNDQARFTVGKYLSPKLYVSYGVGLFENGNVLRLLYDLGGGFKLRTETAAQQSGGDLLYSKDR